jgi:large subunit ribosomal protein L13
MARHPERIVERAIYGMLPKNSLGRQRIRRKLRVYAGADHPHAAQQPTVLTLSKSEAK